ncbi:hypothetical protein IHQ71_09535 [Rhizobium sp. TH2]|nr:hypothetical protein IHQ71_09535 [Rhizobium sp. TH2]
MKRGREFQNRKRNNLGLQRRVLDRAALVRRLLTCFLGARVALAPRSLEPDAGPAFLFDRLRLAGGVSEVDDRVLRLLRFVAVDFPVVFLSISLIALLTMPEMKVSITPAMPLPVWSR